MNNFRRSVAEIVQIVKIADSTVRKRLEEFKKTGSAALSVGDFRSVWLEEESEPPAFVRGREKEERERLEMEDADVGSETFTKSKGKGKGKGKKRKRRRDNISDDETRLVEIPPVESEIADHNINREDENVIDPVLFNQGILAGTSGEPLFLPEDPDQIPDIQGFAEASAESYAEVNAALDQSITPPALPINPPDPSPIEASLDAALAEEVSSFLETAKGAQLSEALENAAANRAADSKGDKELEGLDEEELDAFILTEDEVRMKERVWVEMNRDYLENLAGKQLAWRRSRSRL